MCSKSPVKSLCALKNRWFFVEKNVFRVFIKKPVVKSLCALSPPTKLSTRVLKPQRSFFSCPNPIFPTQIFFCSNKLSTRVLKPQRSFFSLFPKPIFSTQIFFGSNKLSTRVLKPQRGFCLHFRGRFSLHKLSNERICGLT